MMLIVGASMMLWSATGSGASADPSGILPDELSILQMTHDGRVLDEGLVCLQETADGIPLLPIVGVARDLGFHLRETDGGVEGTINGPSDSFRLDTVHRRVKCRRAASLSIPADQLSVQGGVTYVAPAVLGQWLGVQLVVQRREMLVLVHSTRPLPCDRRTSPTSGSGQSAPNEEASILSPTRSGMPTTDFWFGVRTGGGDSTSATVGLFGRGALWGADTQITSSSETSDPLGNARLRFERPLGRGRLQFGDIAIPAGGVLGSGGWGRGIAITQSAFVRSSGSGGVIEGVAPPGWDVEIYLGRDLVGAQTADEQGRFRFDSVPTPSAMNRYELVFYGPDGQVRRSSRSIYLGSFLLSKGESRQGFWLAQASERLLADSPRTSDPASGELRALYSFEKGIADNLTLRTTIGRAAANDSLPTTCDVEARTIQGKWDLSLSGAIQDQGGIASIVALRSSLGRARIQLRHGFLSRFAGVSSGGETRDWRDLTDVQLSAPVRLGAYSASITAAFETHQERSFRAYRAYGTLVTSTRRWLLATGLDALHDRNGDSVEGQTTLRMLSRIGPQMDLRYTLGSAPSFSLATLTYDLNRDPANRLSLGFGYDDSVVGGNALRLGVHRGVGPLDVGMDIVAGTVRGPRLEFNIGVGIQENARTRSLRAIAPGTTSGGSVSAFAFLDNNGSGVYDAGDTPVPGVGFIVDHTRNSARTDRSGICDLSGIRPGEVSEIRVDESTLEDPDYVPLSTPTLIRARAGANLAVDFPITPCGELDGKCAGEPLRSVELRSENGKMRRTTTTDESGAFVFSQVPAGAYTLRVEDGPPQRLVVTASRVTSIELP